MDGTKTMAIKKYHKISNHNISILYVKYFFIKYIQISFDISKTGCNFGCRFSSTQIYEY